MSRDTAAIFKHLQERTVAASRQLDVDNAVRAACQHSVSFKLRRDLAIDHSFLMDCLLREETIGDKLHELNDAVSDAETDRDFVHATAELWAYEHDYLEGLV